MCLQEGRILPLLLSSKRQRQAPQLVEPTKSIPHVPLGISETDQRRSPFRGIVGYQPERLAQPRVPRMGFINARTRIRFLRHAGDHPPVTAPRCIDPCLHPEHRSVGQGESHSGIPKLRQREVEPPTKEEAPWPQGQVLSGGPGNSRDVAHKGAITKSSPKLTLGTSGWNQYDVLTSPGDLTGDGRTDLIARQKSTGDVYLCKATSTRKLSARTKIRTAWKGYKKLVGAGDLNGDGYGDLLAQDKSNELWRYNGTASGNFKSSRVKVFNDWGSSYNVIVGVGDITGDGKADLVSRHTAGNLWRNSGDGKGSFGARTKIATGWKAYKGVF
jgi:hypothetical protein